MVKAGGQHAVYGQTYTSQVSTYRKKCTQQLTEHINFLDQGSQDHIGQSPTGYVGASKYEKAAKNTDESNFSTYDKFYHDVQPGLP